MHDKRAHFDGSAHIEEAYGVVSDRYYRALYTLFVRPRILEMNKHHLFLHVVFKTLTNDKTLSEAYFTALWSSWVTVHMWGVDVGRGSSKST